MRLTAMSIAWISAEYIEASLGREDFFLLASHDYCGTYAVLVLWSICIYVFIVAIGDIFQVVEGIAENFRGRSFLTVFFQSQIYGREVYEIGWNVNCMEPIGEFRFDVAESNFVVIQCCYGADAQIFLAFVCQQ